MIIKVDENNYYKRIDKFLKNQLKDMPLSAIFSFLRKGKIKVNQKRVKKPDFEIFIGDSIEIYAYHKNVLNEKKQKSSAPDYKFEILFEDEFVLVINKPYDMSSHGGTNIVKYSVIDILNDNYSRVTSFLVHRLDKYTSGAMVIAKKRDVARRFTELFSLAKVDKKYIALVTGKTPQKGVVKSEIESKDAFTSYRRLCVLDLGDNNYLSEVEVSIKTGRKHQIRRHMSSIGYPVLGDDLYGDWNFNKKVKHLLNFKGYVLQCFYMNFSHPITGKNIEIKVKPDDRFEKLKRKLK